jgi:hypothetical protein
MDDLIGRRVANAGVFRAAATQIPGIFPQPPLEQEPFHKLSPGISSTDSAEAATSASYEHESSDAHGCLAESKANASVQQRYLEFHTWQTGEYAAGEIVGAVPGPGQFV